MPHDRIAMISGNKHARSIKGSMFEHDPNRTVTTMMDINRAGARMQKIAGEKE